MVSERFTSLFVGLALSTAACSDGRTERLTGSRVPDSAIRVTADAGSHDAVVRDADATIDAGADAGSPDVGVYDGPLILATFDDHLWLLTFTGDVVSSLTIPGNDTARDLVLLLDGRIAVYNGTFDPELSIYDGSSWTSLTHPAWSTINNTTYGGLAALGSFVFAANMRTANQEANGLIRFDLELSTSATAAEGADIIDVAIGLDDRLYALEYNEESVHVFDPLTLDPLRIVSLDADVRAIAVDAGGRIFGAALNGTLYRFDAEGAIEESIAGFTERNYFADVDIDAGGRLLVSTALGEIAVTDVSFSSWQLITLPHWQSAFVTFDNRTRAR
jgi:hypothetical protein